MKQVIFRENLRHGERSLTSRDILPAIEEILTSLYSGKGLSWYRVLEVPCLRQIRGEYDCFDTPQGICSRGNILTPSTASRSCFRCLAHQDSIGHLCTERNSKGKIAKEGKQYKICHNKRCEEGFGYCPELGDPVTIRGLGYPKGGHGLYLWLDSDKEWKIVLARLQEQKWIDTASEYVSVAFTSVVSPVNFVRIKLHFHRSFEDVWKMTNDVEMG